MKNIFRISVIVLLTLTHALTVFSPQGAGSELAAASICRKVSQTTSVISCSPGGVMPQVGWNT
jgi:hypothetical protein